MQPAAAETSQQGATKKRKRARAALSCIPCKQKKIKCTRTLPCSNCIRRDIVSECKWAAPELQPPDSVYTFDKVFQEVRTHFEGRIKALESLLNVPASTTSDAVARSALLSLGSSATDARSNSAPSNGIAGKQSDRDGGSDYESGSDGEEIDEEGASGAAFALEILAGGEIVDMAASGNGTSSGLSTKAISLEDFSLTSILATPQRDLSITTANTLDADIPLLTYVNGRNLVDSLLAYVQSKQMAEKLCTPYFETYGPMVGFLVPRQFWAEHNAFWTHLASGQREFDLAWMATLSLLMAAGAQQSMELGPKARADNLYRLGHMFLTVLNWRQNPSRRVVQALLLAQLYVQNENDMASAQIYHQEALGCAQSLSWHKLGDDPSTLPQSDKSLPEGSMFARETAVRLWWEIVNRDWLAPTQWRHPSIPARSFDTGWPRTVPDEIYETASWDAVVPAGSSPPSSLAFQIGKMECAVYMNKIYQLGQLPTAEASLAQYHSHLCQLGDDFMKSLRDHMKGSGMSPDSWENPADWRPLIGRSGVACRRLRAHRPFMLRGYKDPSKYGPSVKVCVDCAMDILEVLHRLDVLQAPIQAFVFLGKHLLSACTTLFIDVMHDVDIGIPEQVSDGKLRNLPAALKWLKSFEMNGTGMKQEMGKRGRLLIEGLQDATEARRRSTGGSERDYAKQLKEVATTMRRAATATPPSNGIASDLAPITWLDDPETRSLLTTLGLLDSGSINRSGPSQDYGIGTMYDWSSNASGDTFDITAVLDTASFDISLDRLDSYNFS